MSNKKIQVAYKLYAPMGDNEREMIEEATAEFPFSFISGMGLTLDAFEAQIASLNQGDKFDFTLSVDDAYGPFEQERVITLPKKTFEIEGRIDSKHIYEGAVVPLMNAEGQRFNGTISEIGETDITVDLNHPLAGKVLTFVGEVLESREATNQEIEQMVKALAGEGCGCGGNCGGGCGGNCEGGCEGGCGEGGCGCGK